MGTRLDYIVKADVFVRDDAARQPIVNGRRGSAIRRLFPAIKRNPARNWTGDRQRSKASRDTKWPTGSLVL